MNYSGFWRRYAACFIDGMALTIPGLLAGGVLRNYPAGLSANIILGALYYPVFESSVLSATPGKALMGIVVLSEAGERISFKQALIRHLCRYISMLICYIGYLMQPFTAKRQTLHDMISGCIVVERASEDLNYFLVWKDQFKDIANRL
jgi:uncharacterized RDD family membrane protein YckC